MDRPRKYPRREPWGPGARKLIADVKAAVTSWHAGTSDASVTVAHGCRPAERIFAYQALEALQLGDEGTPGFYVDKVGEGTVRARLLMWSGMI